MKPVSSSFRVGKYWCDLSMSDRGKMRAEWRPCFPPRASLSESDIAEYYRGRNATIEEYAKVNGILMAVVDI